MNPQPDLRSLPRPTDEQYRAFADHVGEAHSWYKHLPLLTGGQFVVFVALDSGIGNLVVQPEGTRGRLVTPPEGPLFTEARPRLHYSWTTTDEYRRRFGYLDYARRTHEDGTFSRDVGGPMKLPAEIWESCTFTLFPYVSGSSGRDSLRFAHEAAVEQLRAGASHPQRETILEWARLIHERQDALACLSDAEREMVIARRCQRRVRGPITRGVDRYSGIEAQLDAVYFKQLRPGELAKIRKALDELRSWLSRPAT